MKTVTNNLLHVFSLVLLVILSILNQQTLCLTNGSGQGMLQCYRGHLENRNASAKIGDLNVINCSHAMRRQDVTASRNLPDIKHTSSNVTHCVIVFKVSNSSGETDDLPLTNNVSPDFWCDFEHLCDHHDIKHNVLSTDMLFYKGLAGKFFCCNTSLCNSYQVVTKLMQAPEDPIVCYNNNSNGDRTKLNPEVCPSGHCYTLWEGNKNPVYGCDGLEHQCHKNHLTSSGCNKSEGRELCCCSSSKCNYLRKLPGDFVATHLSPGSPMPRPGPVLHWQLIAGIAGGIVAFALLLVTVAVVVVKLRQRRQDYMSYIYSQLTSDLVDESPTDDDMIEP